MNCIFLIRKVLNTDSPPLSAFAPCLEYFQHIGAYQVKRKQDILTFEWEWENYPLEEYNSPRPYFDNIRKVESLARKDFHHEDVIEDH